MSEPAKRRMTAEEFLAWAVEQPEGQRYELMDGEVVGMASKRVAHARAKGLIYRRLFEAVRDAGLTCEAFPDGVALRVDAQTVYEPDAMLRCGPPLPGDTVMVEDPVIVVEVFSPSTGGVDTGVKLADYFRIPSIHHYLIVRPGHRTIIHYARGGADTVSIRILGDGPLRLDPPGIVLENLLPPA